MKPASITFLLPALTGLWAAGAEAPDSAALSVGLREVAVTAIKQTSASSLSGAAVTIVDADELQRLDINAPKGLSEVAPNFFAPDYGSRMTSSIYVRGMGARIDQPVVGLNVDNVPYLNKDAYDFDLPDLARMEVARGPQSTLYGRNTMGGVVNVYTLSPLKWQGVRGMVTYGTHNTLRASAGVYTRLSDALAMSLSALYGHSDGFFTNSYDGSKCGLENHGTIRWKTVWAPTARVSVENVASVTRDVQHGYPYASAETDRIEYNDPMFYRRTSFTDGLTVKHVLDPFTMSSITSFQWLDDCMTLDQDYLPLSYFTLTQARREWAVTEDIVLTGESGSYNWLAGAFGFVKRMSMDAPVTFKQDGIDRLILNHVNSILPQGMELRWDTPDFVLGSNFRQPTWGAALYHQSSLSLGQVNLTAGLRLDVEHTSLDYHSLCNTSATMYRNMPGGASVALGQREIDLDDRGNLHNTFVELLPKLSATWQPLSVADFYASISRGYKAGGYNTQMFSDVLQQSLMASLGIEGAYDPDEIMSYRPESSWNFEVGANYSSPSGNLTAGAALFYIACRDQQLTVFPDGATTGRIMANADRTRSYGAELTATWRPCRKLSLSASYGLTNARFERFRAGTAEYDGKRIPCVPSNTLFAQATWTSAAGSYRIEATASCRGAGSIMWDEKNTLSQPFYATLAARASVGRGPWTLTLWGENLTSTQYNTFYFVSIGNAFLQRGRPAHGGLTLRLDFAN